MLVIKTSFKLYQQGNWQNFFWLKLKSGGKGTKKNSKRINVKDEVGWQDVIDIDIDIKMFLHVKEKKHRIPVWQN